MACRISELVLECRDPEGNEFCLLSPRLGLL
ncbi:VOC family protein [Cryobacterium melibiosiphilum]